MRSQGLKKISLVSREVLCGRYTKKEAAQLISSGTQHVHSTQLGKTDPGAKLTLDGVLKKKAPLYVWEKFRPWQTVWVTASDERCAKINEIVKAMDLKRGVQEKTQMVLEELLSNSIFHSYQNPNQTPKYGRRQNVLLNDKETIKVDFYQSKEGVYLSVTDQGGTLAFESVGKAFSRCYGSAAHQIEKKETGAGLGIYMIFENMTHLKIESVPKHRTRFSVWISERHGYDPGIFSFNFFTEDLHG